MSRIFEEAQRVLVATALGTSLLVGGPTAHAQAESNLNAAIDPTSFLVRYETFQSYQGDVADGCITPGYWRVMRFSFHSQNKGFADAYLGHTPPGHQNGGPFVWSEAHGHHHVPDFNFYDLLDASTGQNVQPGYKQAFCLEDVEPNDPNAGPRKYTDCVTQGISAGWDDVYGKTLPCQFINVTNVPDGDYVLVARTNANQVIQESDPYDNGTALRIRLSWNAATVLNPSTPPSSLVVKAGSGTTPDHGAAISRKTNSYDFFYKRSGNGILYHREQDAITGTWGPGDFGHQLTVPGGGAVVGSPAAASWDSNRWDVFARTSNDNLGHWYWEGGNIESEMFQNSVATAPSVVALRRGRLAIAHVNSSGARVVVHYISGYPTSAVLTGSYRKETPAIVALGSSSFAVLAREAAGSRVFASFYSDATGWSSSQYVGVQCDSVVSAASWNSNRIDAVCKYGSTLMHAYWNGSGWSAPNEGVTGLSAPPIVMANSPGKLDIIWQANTSSEKLFRHYRWNGTWWDNIRDMNPGSSVNPDVNLVAASFADPQWGLFYVIDDNSIRMRKWY